MYKVLSRITRDLWHEAHYETESEARAAANHAFKTGAYQVELYRKCRTGYTLVQKASQTMKQAAERCGKFLVEDVPELM